MADRTTSHGNTELTYHSRASTNLEQGQDRRSEATIETKARLGKGSVLALTWVMT